jgi:mono/diheme cytochrome c family protein
VANFATVRKSSGKRYYFHQFVPLLKEKKAIMKLTKLAMLVLTIAVALFILIPSLSWAAEDGAALYKAKCTACHGPDGAGKPAAKIPSLVSDDAKKKSDADLTGVVNTNPKHAAVAKTLNEDQVKAIIGFVRDLQKK